MTSKMKDVTMIILFSAVDVATAVTFIHLEMKRTEESICATSSQDWCGELYVIRLADAHEELTSCEMQHPQQVHADHSEGCMHTVCDESREAFTRWVFPANSYLLRRGELSHRDRELQVLLAKHIGGNWPLPVKTVTEMGY